MRIMKLFLFIFRKRHATLVTHHQKIQNQILNSNHYPIQSLPIASSNHA